MVVDWMVVVVCVPGKPNENAGVLVLDQVLNQLGFKLKPASDEWPSDVAMVWETLSDELNAQISERGGKEVMAWLEKTLGHTIRVSDRKTLQGGSLIECLDQLYVEHVQSRSRVAGSPC